MPKIFEVGGCVRDEILNVHTNDIDFTFVTSGRTKDAMGWYNPVTDEITNNLYF